MKEIFLSLFFLLAFPFSYGQSNLTSSSGNMKTENADIKAIRAVIQQWQDGYNSGQAAKVAALYTQDAYYLTQHYFSGIIHGRDSIQAYVQLGVDAKYHIDSIRIKELHVDENFAYVITRYYSLNGGVKAFGVNLVVLKRIHGKWMIKAHEAAVPDPKEAIRELNLRNNQ